MIKSWLEDEEQKVILKSALIQAGFISEIDKMVLWCKRSYQLLNSTDSFVTYSRRLKRRGLFGMYRLLPVLLSSYPHSSNGSLSFFSALR